MRNPIKPKMNTAIKSPAEVSATATRGAYYIRENGTWFQASGHESTFGLRRLSEDEADQLVQASMDGDKKNLTVTRRVAALCRKYGEADKIGESIFGHA